MSNSNDDYDEHRAKEEILRLNKYLKEPILLIGGLAVQQYVLERRTKDIDIVCSLSLQKALLADAYGHPRYEKRQQQTDLRPVYEIKNLETGGKVFLGTKILERERYPYIDYNILSDDSVAFRYNDTEAEKVRVPPPHALAFSKLVSFIARRESKKGIQDLTDFSKLTNNKYFSLNSIVSLVQRLDARDFIEEFFRSTQLKEPEIAVLAEASPVRFQSIFPIETISFIAERGKRGIPTFAPIDANYRLRSFDIELKYCRKNGMKYTKSKSLIATKNKVGSFSDRYHWTGDQPQSIKTNNPRHILTERPKKNVWSRYEIDFQRILNEGDEEKVSLTWSLTDEKNEFVPFVSATIDVQTDRLSIRLDARSVANDVENVQVEVLPLQGSGEPIELINVGAKDGVFEYVCTEPRLFHTYEMRWTVIK